LTTRILTRISASEMPLELGVDLGALLRSDETREQLWRNAAGLLQLPDGSS
jgi:hypothetical protein